MKKIITLILVFLLSFTFIGCNAQTTTTYSTPELLHDLSEANGLKNLVIIIGDGMGPEQIKSGEIYYNKTYDFTSWKMTYSNTDSYHQSTRKNDLTTDSAAGGTAIATGCVTINGYVGMNKYDAEVATILDYAKAMGKSTGIVTTDEITGATPADFSGHSMDRSQQVPIFFSQLKSNVDIIIGQYSEFLGSFEPEMNEHGYTYFSSYDNLEGIDEADKAICQFKFQQTNGMVTLKEASEVAINFLDDNENGYVLMIEAAHIDKKSHSNEFSGMVLAMNQMNDTVDYIKSIAGNDTGIIITADHETGGLKVSTENIYSHSYGNAYYDYESTNHTSTYVPVYIYGFDVDFSQFCSLGKYENCIKNSDVFRIAFYAMTGIKVYS